MKHTIIICDICGDRIFRLDGRVNRLQEGSLRITARQLKLIDSEFDRKVVYEQWKRRKYHICRKYVQKIQDVCIGRISNENT